MVESRVILDCSGCEGVFWIEPIDCDLNKTKGMQKNMIKIAICDDEEVFRNKLRGLVKEYLENEQVPCQIDTFSQGIELVKLDLNILNYNIIFLDVNMDELDGIQTAKIIRRMTDEVYLVFVTAHIDYSLEGYKVDAVRYLLKDNKSIKNAVFECLSTLLAAMDYKTRKLKFDFIEGSEALAVERILFVESKLHKLEFHVMKQGPVIYTLYGTLNKIEVVLKNSNFIRAHQSYLVNIRHIKSIMNYKLQLVNDVELPVPKARYRSVKEAFIAYKGEI